MQPAHEFWNEALDLSRAIVAQAPAAVILADRDGAIRVWNRGAESVFGYSADEVPGKSLDAIIPERLRGAHREGFRRAIDAGRPRYVNRTLTTRSVHKDGRKLYVDLSFGLLRDQAGAVVGAPAIARDCTDRHLSDRALRTRVRAPEDELKVAPGQALGS